MKIFKILRTDALWMNCKIARRIQTPRSRRCVRNADEEEKDEEEEDGSARMIFLIFFSFFWGGVWEYTHLQKDMRFFEN